VAIVARLFQKRLNVCRDGIDCGDTFAFLSRLIFLWPEKLDHYNYDQHDNKNGPHHKVESLLPK
jgi:hypothetical protein